MKTFAAWFTLERRDAIRAVVVTLAPFLILLGFGTKSEWDQYVIITGIVLQVIGSLLSLLTIKGLVNIWTILRATIYTAGLALAPALVALGFWTNDFANNFTVGLALLLTVLSNVVGIIVGNKQQTEAVRAEARHRASAAL